MLIVDRSSFIAWTDGILFDRTPTTLVVGDNVRHDKALKALECGETIGLSVNGRLFSTLAFDKTIEAYVEVEL